MSQLPFSEIVQGVWSYVLGYYTDKGYMPTLEEIAEHFSSDGNSYSKEWARLCLKELESQGKLKIIKFKSRGIELI